jgi:hypothetical protein
VGFALVAGKADPDRTGNYGVQGQDEAGDATCWLSPWSFVERIGLHPRRERGRMVLVSSPIWPESGLEEQPGAFPLPKWQSKEVGAASKEGSKPDY